MTVAIHIPGIDVALGHSVIYDEYKGDLAQAQQIAEQQLTQARETQSAVPLVDALLARAVVHLLQGETPAALACCDEIAQTASADPAAQLRAASYATLAAYQRWNAYPGGAAADGTEFDRRSLAFLTVIAAQGQRRTQLEPQISDPALQLEARLVGVCLPSLLQARTFALQADQASAELATQLRDLAVQAPQTLQQAALDASPSLRAYADLAAAELHQRLGQSELAEQLLAQASAIYSAAGDAAGAAVCRMRRADWTVASFSSPLVWNLALQSSTTAGSDLSSTIETREWSRATVDLAAAQAAYAEAELLFQQAQAPRGLAWLQLRRGYLALLADDFADALVAVEQAETQFATSGDRLGYWLARVQAALLRIAAGALLEDHETARAVGEWGASEGSFSYALGLGILCSRMGRHWLLRRGDYERALACYRLAVVLNAALGATTHQAQGLVDQASVLESIGERDGALLLYEQAIELYTQQIQALPEQAETLRQRTILLTSDVYQLYEQSMDGDGMERVVARLEPQIAQVGGVVGGFFNAATAVLRGQSQDGLDHGLTIVAAQYAREVIQWSSVLIPSYRARAARDRGDTSEAQRQFALAEAAAQQVSGLAHDFLLGTLLGHQRRYAEATTRFQRYFAGGDPSSTILGKVLAVFGAQGQAEQQLQQQRLHDQAASAFVRLKAYAEARLHLDALEQSAGAEWWRDLERPWEALSDYGEMYEGLGQLERALTAYDQAIGLLEARRQQLSRDELKTALAAGRSPQYVYFYAARAAQKLQAHLAQAGDLAQGRAAVARAFDYAERGKARALLDLLASSAALAQLPRAESDALRAWRELTAALTLWRGLLARERSQQGPDAERLVLLSQQLSAAEAELRQAERELARSDPHFYRLIDPQVQLLSVDAVSAALPPETALLLYFFVGEELLLWAITAQGVALAYLVSLDVKTLERTIRAFHRACEQRQPLADTGAALSTTLLAPATDVLRDHRRLIIVPHGAAHALPFHALPWQGQPLALTHTISYLPNASALQFLRPDAASHPAQILAVGNPAQMSFQPPFGARLAAPPLPAAAAEAAYVASLFPQHTLLLDTQASEAAVRAQIERYPLLHFATHGYLSEDAPLLSALLFADGDALSVYELMSLDLRADLVVLSACRTALGQTTGGDDVLGLTRGLLAAGAGAAIVSLWPVSDVSTSLLMGRFYRHLREGAPPAAALQAAQRELRSLSPAEIEAALQELRQSLAAPELLPTATRDLVLPQAEPLDQPLDYSHPFYWAPFILVG